MQLKNFLDLNRIILDIKGDSKEEIIKELSSLLLDGSNKINETEYSTLVEEILERETLSSTGMQDGIAIPHVKSNLVNELTVAVGISRVGKNFQSLDGKKSKLFFLIVSPKEEVRTFMKLLSTFASISLEEGKVEEILNASTKEEVMRLLTLVEED